MTEVEVQQLLASGKSSNSIYTILGKRLANGELAWLTERYAAEIPYNERLFLYVAKLSVRPTCIACDTVPTFKGYSKGYNKACSSSCARKHSLTINGESIRAKAVATLISRYGVNSQFKLPEAVEAHKASMLKRRGLTVPTEQLLKTRATNFARYGAASPTANLAVKQKTTETMTERYGGYYLAVHGNEHKHMAWAARKEQVLLVDFSIKLLEPIRSTKNRIRALCLSCNDEYALDISDGSVSRCPKCFFKPANRSGKEAELSSFVAALGLTVITNVKSKELIWPYSLDIWIPALRTAIEFNGDYWHREEHVGKNYHLDKLDRCTAQGIELIQIFEHEYDYKKDIVEDRLQSLLRVMSLRVHARKCKIVNVDASTARQFLEQNHMQGAVGAKYSLGLIHNAELVMLLTAGTPRYSTRADFELLRVCTKRGMTVIGGASKLLKRLKSLESGKSLISYHDRRWGSSTFYEELGFKKLAPTSPSYVYVRRGVKLSRYQTMKHRLPKLLCEKFDPLLTESENMSKAGYLKLYDCGQDVFALTL